MTEYVGNVLIRLTICWLIFTQPVLLQRYIYEFDVNLDKVWKALAEPGSILTKEIVILSNKEYSYA